MLCDGIIIPGTIECFSPKNLIYICTAAAAVVADAWREYIEILCTVWSVFRVELLLIGNTSTRTYMTPTSRTHQETRRRWFRISFRPLSNLTSHVWEVMFSTKISTRSCVSNTFRCPSGSLAVQTKFWCTRSSRTGRCRRAYSRIRRSSTW